MIEKDKDITSLTTFGIPVKARYFASYKTLKELQRIIKTEEYRTSDVLHIGGGSNLLFARDYDGLILHSEIKGILEYRKDPNHIYVISGAGEKWSDLVDWCVRRGLAGLENMAGIPGEVGAAPVQNVGAYGREAKDVVFSVECYDTLEHQVVRLTNSDCRFAYRDSMFKREGKGRYYVLRVSFLLTRSLQANHLDYGPLASLEERLGHHPTIGEVAQEVVKIRDSKLPDPAETGSAGSFFKNPVINRYFFEEEVKRRCPDIKYFLTESGEVKLSAGWMIDNLGLKGYSIGGAEVYPKQCLVLANKGGATFADVKKLYEHVQHEVSNRYGVWLQPEVNIIDQAIEVTVLGTGTSKGVPEVGCMCEVCRSEDERDKRMRSSVLVRVQGMNILIDPGPDFRAQALKHGINAIDAVLVTHSHYDHVGGFDDLRPFCTNSDVPVYLRPDVNEDLHRRLDYCFREHLYPGVPKFEMHEISADAPFQVNGVEIVPIEVMHGKLPILGYRIGKFAYITDAKTVDPWEMEKLEGVEVLMVNALRREPHFSHFTVEEALEFVRKVNPKEAWLIHMNHQIGLARDIDTMLPEGVRFAYDGLKLKVGV